MNEKNVEIYSMKAFYNSINEISYIIVIKRDGIIRMRKRNKKRKAKE